MWLRVVALLFYMIPGLVLAQGAEPVVRRPEGPVADASDPRRPAEPPPPDFTGRQYIDSGGCVFLRTAAGWRARLSRDGAMVCGWPPTLAARSPDSEPGTEPRAARIERLLTETIITNLQPGELAEGADEMPPPVRAGPDAASGESVRTAPTEGDPLGLGRMMASAPDLRRQLVGVGRAERLCGLIGAGDPLGLCGPVKDGPVLAAPWVGGATAGPEVAAVAPAAPLAAPAIVAKVPQDAVAIAATAVVAKAPQAAVATTAQTAPAARTPRASAIALPAAAPPATVRSGATSPSTPTSKPATPARTVMSETRAEASLLIPPGARYLEVGAFKEPLEAQALAQKLLAMGLPVVRSKPGQAPLSAVLVGPLEGREAIVRMADRLRKAGFTRLVAR